MAELGIAPEDDVRIAPVSTGAPHSPDHTASRHAQNATTRSVSPADRKLLENYAEALKQCGTGRVGKDDDTGLFVPDFDASCLATRPTAKTTDKDVTEMGRPVDTSDQTK